MTPERGGGGKARGVVARGARAIGAVAGLAAAAQLGLFAAQQAGWRPTPSSAWYARHVAAPLGRVLERRFPRPQIEDWSKVAGAVVLGGAPRRVQEAERLLQAHPHLRVVVSGADPSERQLIARWEPALAAQVVYEDRSVAGRDGTFANARNSAALLRAARAGDWLLVTSAVHMPRAVGAFRAAGVDVVAWPVYDLSTYPESLIHAVHHEWLGLLAYRLSGRSDALAPSPAR